MKTVKWMELSILTSNEALEPICHILNESGANGTVIHNPIDLTIKHRERFGELYSLDPSQYPASGVVVKAYFPENEQINHKVKELEKQFEDLKKYDFDVGELKITLTTMEEDDWAHAWKRFYKPKRVTETFTIVPTWEQYTPTSPNEKLIEMDPGMAFGTGTHPTTILSIQALEKYINKNDIIMDIGCGSGILSIVSVLLGAKTVYAYDLDEVAVNSTIQNVKLNHVNEQVIVQQNDLLNGVNKKVDLIVSNILAEIIISFTQDAWANLNDGGLFITSGIIEEKRVIVKESLEKNRFRILDEKEMDGWVSLVAKKE